MEPLGEFQFCLFVKKSNNDCTYLASKYNPLNEPMMVNDAKRRKFTCYQVKSCLKERSDFVQNPIQHLTSIKDMAEGNFDGGINPPIILTWSMNEMTTTVNSMAYASHLEKTQFYNTLQYDIRDVRRSFAALRRLNELKRLQRRANLAYRTKMLQVSSALSYFQIVTNANYYPLSPQQDEHEVNANGIQPNVVNPNPLAVMNGNEMNAQVTAMLYVDGNEKAQYQHAVTDGPVAQRRSFSAIQRLNTLRRELRTANLNYRKASLRVSGAGAYLSIASQVDLHPAPTTENIFWPGE